MEMVGVNNGLAKDDFRALKLIKRSEKQTDCFNFCAVVHIFVRFFFFVGGRHRADTYFIQCICCYFVYFTGEFVI